MCIYNAEESARVSRCGTEPCSNCSGAHINHTCKVQGLGMAWCRFRVQGFALAPLGPWFYISGSGYSRCSLRLEGDGLDSNKRGGNPKP